jgi:endonuclease/exonuclease/phosphatase family metal-dependent hydrolase
VKVITYNLHKGLGRRKRHIVHELAHALAERQPDLLLCQEVFHSFEDEIKQCHFLTSVVGHPHVFAPNAFRNVGCHGNATFANLRIDRHENIDVSDWFLQKRGILRVWLERRRQPLEVLNVHFSLTGGRRRRQWQRLLESLPPDPGVPVIACGDFNDWRGVLDRSARRSQMLHNALWSLPWTRRRTYPSHRPWLALDRVYFRGLRVVEARVLTGPPWSELSDHLPVEVVFD